MEDKILTAIKLRPSSGLFSDELLQDIIKDTVSDVRAYVNYKDDEELPEALSTVIKELVLFKLNRVGAEGVQSQKSGGIDETFSDITQLFN